MEQRLKLSSSPRPAISTNTDKSSEQQQIAEKAASKDRSRPGTARQTQQAPSSGDMPPTPGGSEGE